MAEIIEPLITPIGQVGAQGDVFIPSNNAYDIAVGGMPFFLAASQNYPYKRETAPYRRTQIDQTREPGEQTLLGWWLRSQSSFHLGQGVKYQEPVQGDTVGYRYFKGAGVDVWTPGKVTLLRSVTSVYTPSASPLMMGFQDSAGANAAFVSDGSALKRISASGTVTTITWGGSGTILAMAQDGTNYYVANATGIYKGPLTGATNGTLWHTFASSQTRVILSWIKQRIMAGLGASIVEIVAGTGTTVYTSPNANWVWSGVADGPNSIYFSGYCGTSSTIVRINLDTDGTLPTLTQAVTAAEMPGGEFITSIASYIGRYIAIGTNFGVRIGVIDSGAYSNGAVTYGPLSVVTNGYDHIYDRTISGSNVTGFTFDDRFVYATVTNFIDNGDDTLSSGLVRIDLSREVSPGMFAWATDLRTMTTATVVSTDNLGTTDRKLIATTNNVYMESTGALVASGYLQTGQIRYLTLEDKHFKLIKPRFVRPMTGDVALSTVLANGTIIPIMVIDNTVSPQADISVGLNSPQESVAFRFDMLRDDTTNTLSSTFTGYQLKALPAVKRARQLTIPLMNYDFEEDRYNLITGYEGRAWERINLLEGVEANGDTVVIQDFTTGEQVLAVIETLQFVRMTPPERRYKGFGGILYITARTV